MKELLPKIANAELEILKLLWRTESKLTMPEIRDRLKASTGWQAPTVKTLLYRLCDKGAVVAEKQDDEGAEKRGMFLYSAAISEKEYHAYATTSLANKLFDGSVKNLVATLLDGNRFSDADLAELRMLLKQGDENA